MSGTVIHGDALAILAAMADDPSHDPATTVVLTDPPWPDCPLIEIDGGREADVLWPRAARRIAGTGYLHPGASRLILWLGHNTDPRRMVGGVPDSMPFRTVVTLRMVPPGYRGCLMGGDLAYVFGPITMPPGQHILAGEIVSNGPEHRHERGKLDHPCPRSPMHARGLVKHYCAGAKLIIDPFCGSGTTLVAAAEAGIDYIGIDSDERWVIEARARLARTFARGIQPELPRLQQIEVFDA